MNDLDAWNDLIRLATRFERSGITLETRKASRLPISAVLREIADLVRPNEETTVERKAER